jgi:hypothetical protein
MIKILSLFLVTVFMALPSFAKSKVSDSNKFSPAQVKWLYEQAEQIYLGRFTEVEEPWFGHEKKYIFTITRGGGLNKTGKPKTLAVALLGFQNYPILLNQTYFMARNGLEQVIALIPVKKKPAFFDRFSTRKIDITDGLVDLLCELTSISPEKKMTVRFYVQGTPKGLVESNQGGCNEVRFVRGGIGVKIKPYVEIKEMKKKGGLLDVKGFYSEQGYFRATVDPSERPHEVKLRYSKGKK